MEFIKVEPKQNQPAESETSLRPSQPFPTDALPRVMQEVVKTIAKAQSVPESLVAYPALSHGAAAIGNSCKAICYSDGGGELPTFWTGILADSGVGKSEVLRKLGSPFETIEKGYTENYNAEMELYQSEKKAGNTVALPKEKHLLTGNATMEAIFVMCSGNPHGLLLSESEGRLFFAFDSYRKAKTDEANYCKLYDGAYFKIGRKGSSTLSGTGIMSVAMMIQPDNFRKALTENLGMTTSGLLARMHLCYPPVGKYQLANQIDGTVYSDWNDTLVEIIGNRTEDGKPIEIYQDNAAKNTWDRYMLDSRNLARRTRGWLGGYYDRLHVTAMRIAIQIHCFEVGGNVMNSDSTERGIAIAEYMKSENERVVDLFSSGEESVDKEAESILAKIRELGNHATVRELVHKMAKYRPAGGSQTLEKKLNEMVIAGKLTRHFEPGGNNQTVENYCLVTP